MKHRSEPGTGKQPPERLPDEGILLGYSLEHELRTAPIGFMYGAGHAEGATQGDDTPSLDPILHTGGGHLMTIAPTGGGKGVSCVIPTLLRFPGPVIVVDPKGENYAVAGERRRALGQQLVVLDPIGITGASEVGALNPMDLVDPDDTQSIDDSAALASLLSGGIEREDPRNLFWYQRGEHLLTALIQHVAVTRPPARRHLGEVRRILNLPVEQFLELAGTEMAESPDSDVRQVMGMLANPASEMIGSILGMAQNSLGFLRGELVDGSTTSSTLDLEAVTAGEPLSIFIVIPPDKLESHRNLLRLWIGTLMAALMRRRAPVPHSTLLMLDEAAQLGPLEQLRQAITLMRGYGLQTWSFWQDVSQLHNLYPRDWETMYNNCRVHQAFGFTTLKSAEAACSLLGFHDPLEALQLDADEMILSVSGDEAVIAQKPNYLTDPAFSGLYSSNPFYTRSPDELPRAMRPKRVYIRPAWRPLAVPEVIDEVAAEIAGDAPVETDDQDDDDAGLPAALLRALGGSDAPQATTAGSGSPRGGSVLDPLQGIIMPPPAAVPELVDWISDHTDGGWNPVTTRIRGVNLPFYGKHVLLEFQDPERDPPRVLGLKHGASFRRLVGGADGFARLNREIPLALDDANVADYVRLRSHVLRFGEHRIRLAETVDQLAFWTGTSSADLAPFSDLLHPATTEPREDPPGWRVSVTGLSDGSLLALELSVTPGGHVEEVARKVVHPSVGTHPYPAAAPGGGLDEGTVDTLAQVHGRWESVAGPEWRSMLPDVPDRASLDGAPTVLRRALACYPSVEVIAVWSASSQAPRFFFYRPGECHKVWLDTVWPSEKNRYGEGHVTWSDADAAVDYVRFFTWFSNGFPDGPLDYRILLDRFEQLPLRDEAAPGDPVIERLRRSWIPLRTIPKREDDSEKVVARVEGTWLQGTTVSTMEFVLASDGNVREENRVTLVEDVSLDEARLRRLLAFPPVGAPSSRSPDTQAAPSLPEEAP